MEADDPTAEDDGEGEGYTGIGVFCEGYRARHSYGQSIEAAGAMAQSLGVLAVDSRFTGCGGGSDTVHMAVFHNSPIGPEGRSDVVYGERFCSLSRL
jgi:hypothetical protein